MNLKERNEKIKNASVAEKRHKNTILTIVFIILVILISAITYFTGDLSTNTSTNAADTTTETTDEVQYTFRSDEQLQSHYEKHGVDMGFESAEEYEKAASAVVNNEDALHKTESEDGDDVYYIEDTNEFVIVSTDGYIRTYFYPDAGKAYYDKQ